MNEMLHNVSDGPQPYAFLGRAAIVDASTRRAHGGQGFILHPQWKSRVTFRDCIGIQHDFAASWLTVKNQVGRKPLHLGCVYWPDSGKCRAHPGLFRAAKDHLCDGLTALGREVQYASWGTSMLGRADALPRQPHGHMPRWRLCTGSP